MFVDLLSSNYGFNVPHSNIEKCQTLGRQMSHEISSVLINC